MNEKKLIAFDLYDTCIHHEKNLSDYKKIFSHENISDITIKNIRDILQKTPINIEDANFSIPKNLIDEINNLTQKNIATTVLYPDTIPTLNYLKSKWYKLAVISNLAKKYERPLRELFPKWIFDYEALSFNIWDIKPNPWIFESIRDQSGVDFNDMIMIWDKLDIDVWWAKNVWIDGIQIDRTMKEKWPIYKEDYIKISTLSELKKIL